MVRNKFSEKPEVPIMVFEESKTEQDCVDEVDIKVIMRKAENKEYVAPSGLNMSYNDFTNNTNSLQECFDIVDEARKLFDNLGADVKKEFAQDPVKLMEFISNPDNRERAMELGLIDKPEPEYIQQVKIVKDENEPTMGE